MTLPFRKLPYLVIKVILETMGFIDLFMLSCTSAKTKRIVKNVFKIRNHWYHLIVKQSLILKIVSETDEDYCEQLNIRQMERLKHLKPEHVGNVFHINIGDVDNVPSLYIKGDENRFSLSTYWSDRKVGFKVIYDALFEIFGGEVEEVAMNVEEIPVRSYQNEIDWIENQFPALPSFGTFGRCSFQDYIWLMKNVKAKSDVAFSMNPIEYPESHEIVDLEMKEISIDHGRWMKLQDIQAIRAYFIVIRDVSLTDNEINMLLRNLDAFKEKSNLIRMALLFNREADPEVVLEGLDVINEDEMKPEDCLNQWSFGLANGKKCTILYAAYENDQPDVEQFGFEIRIRNKTSSAIKA